MELDGNEKRIRALFSELSFQDQIHAPGFEDLWRRAEHATPTQAHYFRPFIAFAAAAVIAAFILAVWLRSTPTSSADHNAVHETRHITEPSPAPPVFARNNPPSSKERKRPRVPRNRRIERNIEPATIAAAEMLSSWRSPTTVLMASTTAVFNSLPQLNHSAEEFKEFLTNDAIKESNQ